MTIVSDPTSSGNGTGTEPTSREEISLVGVLVVIARRIGLIAVCGFIFAVAAVVPRSLGRDSYTANASFMQQQSSSAPNPAGLSGLAAQFGIALPSSGGTLNPTFYLDLLTSRVLLARVAQTTFKAPSDSGMVEGNLIRIYGVRRGTPAEQLDRAVEILRKSVAGSLQKNTGAIQLAAKAGSPELAKQLADRLIEQINAFNLEVRQSQASVERQYTEKRLVDAKAELRAKEDELQAFLESNRQTNSAELRLKQDRIEREVSMRQQVYVSLAQAYEQSRLSEIRDTPMIMVLEPATLPLKRDPRARVQYAVLGFLLGSFFGLVLAFALEYVADAKAQRVPEMLELVSILKRNRIARWFTRSSVGPPR